MKAWAVARRGFTIVEVIIVIIVISILATIIIVSLSSVEKANHDGQRDRDITEVMRALAKYNFTNGTYPPCQTKADGTPCNLSELSSALVTGSPSYLQSIPVDPLSNQYQYVRGTDTTSYGIEMNYEGRPNCDKGINNQGATWWSSVPACTS